MIFPRREIIDQLTAGTGEKVQASTTMAFTRLLRVLLKEPELGPRVVPIIPDEARTFGMDALFAEFKIYAPFGQQYEPVDAGLMLSYREATNGQILEEGITEAGAMASFTAAATAYATWGQPMIPFFIFYSMFGFQRIGDLIWSFGDQRGRGFLLGATAGRTTLTGEGLQHCDGQSQMFALAYPELPRLRPRVRVRGRRDRARRHPAHVRPEPEDCFYYLTLYNENYVQPPMPEGVEDGIVRGDVPAAARGRRSCTHHAQILASGPMVLQALEAQAVLAEHYDVAADVWSVPGWKQFRDDALECERWNRLHPGEPPRTPYVTELLAETVGPDRRGDRLGARRSRLGRALRAAALRSARHRRLRLLRHPAGAAAPLRGRRRAHRRRGARRPRPDRRREGRDRRRRDRHGSRSMPTTPIRVWPDVLGGP